MRKSISKLDLNYNKLKREYEVAVLDVDADPLRRHQPKFGGQEYEKLKWLIL